MAATFFWTVAGRVVFVRFRLTGADASSEHAVPLLERMTGWAEDQGRAVRVLDFSASLRAGTGVTEVGPVVATVAGSDAAEETVTGTAGDRFHADVGSGRLLLLPDAPVLYLRVEPDDTAMDLDVSGMVVFEISPSSGPPYAAYVDALRARVDDLEDGAADAVSALAVLDGRADVVDTTLTSLDGRLDTAEATLVDHETRIAALE